MAKDRRPAARHRQPGERLRTLRAAKRQELRTAPAPDEIVCQLCHRTFRAIAVLHLRRIHGFQGEHPIEDYKRRFGLRVAWSPMTCRLLRNVSVARARRDGVRWTPGRVRRVLRERGGAAESLAPSQVPSDLYQAARRTFGGWNTALRAAGIDPAEHLIVGRWSAEVVTQAIRARRAERLALTATQVKRADPHLYTAALHHLGSWGKALRASGLDPARHREPLKWSVAGARTWIRNRLACGQPILARDVPRGLRNRIERDTGMRWPAFVEATGRRYPGNRRTNWTPALVVEAIRERRRRRMPLDITSVNAGPGTLARQGAKYFGSWGGALRAAGLDPNLAGGQSARGLRRPAGAR